MSDRLLVIVPSRNRPESVARVVQAWRETDAFAHAGLIFAVDEDDPKVVDYMDAGRDVARSRPDGVVELFEVQVGGPARMVPKLDAVAMRCAAEWFALGFAGDDHLPRTKGWARRYIDTLCELGTGIVYGDDGYQHENLCTEWAMTADIVRALGRMVPAPVEHLYCDNAIRDLGRAAGCIRYLPDVLIEHMHPVAGKADTDEGYQRVNSSDQFRRDRADFDRWRRTGLPCDAALIRALRGETSTVMPDVMIATRSGALYADGQRINLRRGRTTAHSTHPAVVDNPQLWTPLRVDLPGPPEVTVLPPIETPGLAHGGPVSPVSVVERDVPEVVVPLSVVDPDEAERRAIRAWAVEQDPPVDVSPRGKIPQSVVDQYRARGQEG